MEIAQVVLLIAVTAAVAVIAGYLIAITLILRHVVNRLWTILDAVQATTEVTQPAGAVIDDINEDLDSSRRLLEDCVRRLEDSRVPVGSAADSRYPGERDPGADPFGAEAPSLGSSVTPDRAEADRQADRQDLPRERTRRLWNR